MEQSSEFRKDPFARQRNTKKTISAEKQTASGNPFKSVSTQTKAQKNNHQIAQAKLDTFAQQNDHQIAQAKIQSKITGNPFSALQPKMNSGKPKISQKPSSDLTLQRKMTVENPNTLLPGSPAKQNWEEIKDYFQTLSPSFAVQSTGDISPTSASYCNASPGRITDQCLCDLHNSADPEPWKILIDDSDWPHTEEANRRVTVHSSRSMMEFGAWGGGTQAGQRILQPNTRVLGHELCGHAWLMETGNHPHAPIVTGTSGQPMGRPSHDPTVTIENQVARDMFGANADERGLFAAPHHGESFARVVVTGFPTNSSDVSALPADMQTRLDRVRHEMNISPILHADIVGHADPQGTTSANNHASLQRARAVRNHLVRAGISRRRFLAVEGRGSSECPPGVIGADPACRKAEIFLFNFHGASLRHP
ncbi:MAG: OmpA family protein [Microscillaceae bacterium]|nr:OmpA family protein [Microscillaceae bacterium]